MITFKPLTHGAHVYMYNFFMRHYRNISEKEITVRKCPYCGFAGTFNEVHRHIFFAFFSGQHRKPK